MSKDLFSTQADHYARYRPSYPAEMINFILQYVTGRNTAWDCATGNGQAAILLADHFNKIIATDISEKQLSLAKPHDKIEYITCAAEKTPIDSNSIDLVTVAQAYHWFNFPEFEKEVRRVAKPGGVIAVWTYHLMVTANQRINEIINSFYKEITGPYWDAERKFVDEKYKTIPFNFDVLDEKEFSMPYEWKVDDLFGYLNSWSAVQHYIKANHFNPLTLIADEVNLLWKKDEVIQIAFPLYLKCGAIS